MKVQQTTGALAGMPRAWSSLRALLAGEDVKRLLVVILIMATLTALQPTFFLSRENLANISRQIAANAILALGEFLVITTAGIDLSVGSVMALSMVLYAIGIHAGIWWPLMLVGSIAVGAALGVSNGLMLTKLKLPHAFIPTLAMLNMARGATLLVTGGVPVSGLVAGARYLGSADLRLFTGTRVDLQIPIPFLLAITLYVLVSVMLRRTAIGRHIYATGGNPQAARYAGINVDRVLNLVYMLSGLLAGVAGIVLAGRTNSGYPSAGIGAELDAIAAVIIGGASFFGGRGTTLGVFVGTVIMGLLRNGLNLMTVSPFWQQVMIGLIIVVAVYLDVLRHHIGRGAARRGG